MIIVTPNKNSKVQYIHCCHAGECRHPAAQSAFYKCGFAALDPGSSPG
jgi:hypothetical protein